MRRSELSMADVKEIEGVIRRAEVLHLALTGPEGPYALTVNFGYRDGKFYFHSAPEGRKIDMLKADPRVAFCLHADYEVVRAETGCKWSAKFQSVAGQGRARFLEGEEKELGLRAVLATFGSGDQAIETPVLKRTAVLEITPENLEGKRKGYPAPEAA
jgi:nitroimidazol reductase NimA-like FMN-containing flavoprotein (pyridoxamine 5'-phosphate oxidase superfamily)